MEPPLNTPLLPSEYRHLLLLSVTGSDIEQDTPTMKCLGDMLRSNASFAILPQGYRVENLGSTPLSLGHPTGPSWLSQHCGSPIIPHMLYMLALQSLVLLKRQLVIVSLWRPTLSFIGPVTPEV